MQPVKLDQIGIIFAKDRGEHYIQTNFETTT